MSRIKTRQRLARWLLSSRFIISARGTSMTCTTIARQSRKNCMTTCSNKITAMRIWLRNGRSRDMRSCAACGVYKQRRLISTRHVYVVCRKPSCQRTRWWNVLIADVVDVRVATRHATTICILHEPELEILGIAWIAWIARIALNRIESHDLQWDESRSNADIGCFVFLACQQLLAMSRKALQSQLQYQRVTAISKEIAYARRIYAIVQMSDTISSFPLGNHIDAGCQLEGTTAVYIPSLHTFSLLIHLKSNHMSVSDWCMRWHVIAMMKLERRNEKK